MKNKIIFIGSFKLPKDGHYGGVYYASTTLSEQLRLLDYDIIELDSTLKSINNTKLINRLHTVFFRQFKFFFSIIKNCNSNYMFVFLSAGSSYLDKFIPISLAKLFGIKIIIFPRSGHLVKYLNKTGFKLLIRRTFKLADIIICQSSFWKDLFISHSIPVQKLKIIENWSPNSVLVKSVALSYKPLDLLPLKIIFISRIEQEKGIDDILELAKRLSKKVNVVINIFGNGSYSNGLTNQIVSSKLQNIVRYNGWLDKNESQQIINDHHIAILASKIEGYPNVLLDYLFSKILIISSNIPMIHSVAQSNICYYDQGDVSSLELKIDDILANPSLYTSRVDELYQEKLVTSNLDHSVMKLMEIIKK